LNRRSEPREGTDTNRNQFSDVSFLFDYPASLTEEFYKPFIFVHPNWQSEDNLTDE